MASLFAPQSEGLGQSNNAPQMSMSYDQSNQQQPHQHYNQMPYQQPQQPAPAMPSTNPQMGPAMGQQPAAAAQQQMSSYPIPNTANPAPGAMAPPASIQKLLDENNQYIQLLLDYQSKGRHQQCAEYQRLLHRNLVYLATVADSTNQSSHANSGSPSLSLMPGAGNPANTSSAGSGHTTDSAPVPR